MMILSFVGFLRFSEVSEIRRCDIDFKEAYLKLFIKKSKTVIYHDGHWLFISKVDSIICPVKIIQMYLDNAEI